MSEIEEKIFYEILTIIKDNLQILIYNKDCSLYYFNDYCCKHELIDLHISQELITKFTEETLIALLNCMTLEI